MKFVFTKHATEKLLLDSAKILNINKTKIKAVFASSIFHNKAKYPHQIIGELDNKLHLCVIYTVDNDGIIKIITFYPAKKGRYAS